MHIVKFQPNVFEYTKHIRRFQPRITARFFFGRKSRKKLELLSESTII